MEGKITNIIKNKRNIEIDDVWYSVSDKINLDFFKVGDYVNYNNKNNDIVYMRKTQPKSNKPIIKKEVRKEYTAEQKNDEISRMSALKSAVEILAESGIIKDNNLTAKDLFFVSVVLAENYYHYIKTGKINDFINYRQ